MKWTRTAFRFLLGPSSVPRMQRMRLAFACVAFSAWSLLCFSARAVDGPLSRDLSAFSNSVNRLALSLAKGDPVRAVDYAEQLFYIFQFSTFPDDVGNTPVLVFPVDSYGNTYESLFWSAVYDSAFDWGNSSLPDKSDSFLFKIYTALTNGSISGASSDMSFTNDIVSIRDILTDFSSDFLDVKSDVSLIEEWSQYSQTDIAAIRTLLESGSFSTSGITNVLLQLLESAETYRDTFDYFTGLNNVGENGIHLPDFAYDSGQFRQWRAHLDETQVASLLAALARVEDASTNTTAWGENYQSAITTMLSEIQNGIDDMNVLLFDINEDVDDIHNVDLDYDGTGRSVRKDFGYWQYGSDRSVASDLLDLRRQLGIENPTRTNNLSFLLRQFFPTSEEISLGDKAVEDVLFAQTNGAQSFSATVSSTDADILRASQTNELNLEARDQSYTDSNPFDTLSGLSSLGQSQFTGALDGLNPQTESTIVLFRGNMPLFGGSQGSSPSRSASSNIALDISYPLRDFDDVSGFLTTMNGVMETVWDIVAALLMLWAYYRFYDDVSSGKFEKM